MSKKVPAGYYICVGPDAALIKDFIAGELAARSPEQGPVWEQQVFWAEEPLGGEFWEKLSLRGLFQRPRAVILRQAQNLKAETLRRLSPALARPDPLILPFICWEEAKVAPHASRLRCWTFAVEQGWLRAIPPLDHRSKPVFLRKEAGRLGLSLGPKEEDFLLRSLPQDAGALRLEMEKLALAADSKGKLGAAALELVEAGPELDIFAFLQTLQSGRQPERLWLQYQKNSLETSDAGLFLFLSLLTREARQLWQLLAGEESSLPPRLREGKLELARRLGYSGLARLWDLALRASKGVKSGENDPRQALELLLAGLFRLFSRV